MEDVAHDFPNSVGLTSGRNLQLQFTKSSFPHLIQGLPSFSKLSTCRSLINRILLGVINGLIYLGRVVLSGFKKQSVQASTLDKDCFDLPCERAQKCMKFFEI